MIFTDIVCHSECGTPDFKIVNKKQGKYFCKFCYQYFDILSKRTIVSK
jgi:uncharacterized Zn finger protein (UPF0148 family)